MICTICGQETDERYWHHLCPKSKGGKEKIDCCYVCANQVHMLFNNKELAAMSLDDLMTDSRMISYLSWRKKHKGNYKFRASKEVRAWKIGHRG